MISPPTPKTHRPNLSRWVGRCGVAVLSAAFLGWLVFAPAVTSPSSDSHALGSLAFNSPSDSNAANQLLTVQLQAAKTGWTDDLRRQYAYLRAQQGDTSVLLAFLKSDINLIASDLPFLKTLAHQQIVQNNYPQAIFLLEQVLQLDSRADEVRYQLGLLWLTTDREQATNYLQQIDPTGPLFTNTTQVLTALEQSDLLGLGLTLSELGEWLAAEQVLTQLIDQEPMNWQAYLYRGYIRDQRGISGLDDLETALGLADDPALPLYFLGLHWRDFADKPQAAVVAFELATDIDPDNPAIAIEIALSYQQLGRDDLAATWFEYTVRLDPYTVDWHRLRAAFYAEGPPESINIQPIEQSLVLFPQDAHLLTSMGYANYKLGQYTTARAQLIEAVRLDPTLPRTQYYYAVTMEQFGDVSAALEGYLAAYESRLAYPNPYAILAERALFRLRVLS